ncbi:NAC domain-containing protein 60-like [Impatiens glandulifera]|uniref:NAC domain-containing protein 60-like n=1 Tax=Impatiens glandulifera TaxID=253017 RepID=UPI001FB15DFE|nr:NAC domain-containing protein 60-like [Impatiens glandulifera]XP_047316444.1 NAC domain-containing protein 60-like [Impatiens glandulifera]
MAAQTPIQKLKWLTSLPSVFTGFRSSPTDGDLVNYYLDEKIQGSERSVYVIPEVESKALPGISVIQSNLEQFYFSTLDKKYPEESLSATTNQSGYWKASGKECNVTYASEIIGKKRTLFFYVGQAPGGEKTGWFMYELSSIEKQKPFVICRLRRSNGEMIDTRLSQFGEEWKIIEHSGEPEEQNQNEKETEGGHLFLDNINIDHTSNQLASNTAENSPASSSKSPKRKNSASHSKRSDGWNFDMTNVPDEVRWLLADAKNDKWCASIDDEIVPKSTTLAWQAYCFNAANQ